MKLFGNSRDAARSGTQSRENKVKKGRNGKKMLIIVLSVILALVLVMAVLVAVYVKPPEIIDSGIATEQLDPDTGDVAQSEQTETMKKGYFNILLAGTDNDGIRTDTMMIARIDAVNHSVALMSIPRDTLIESSTGAPAKLNSVYGANGCGEEGMEALMLELERILGFMPSGYALVDLDVFVELVDAVGGVYFDVPERMYHIDPTQDLYIDLEPGYQQLDGEKAMQLVRFRGYVQADIQRTHVQQDFIVEVAKQCISKPGKIGDYIEIFSRNVLTNFTTGNLLYFAQELMQCDLDNMTSYTLPGTDLWLDAVAYYDLIPSEVLKIVEKDFNPYLD